MQLSVAAVGYEDEAFLANAQELALTLHLPVNNVLLPRLCFTAQGLSLCMQGFLPLRVDLAETVEKRAAYSKKDGLIRACKPHAGINILDTTAGWGKDAAILASFGASVLMLERQPIMAALLTDGLKRLYQQHAGRIKLALLPLDAHHYLKHLNLSDYPHVIYLDPMHPVRKKSALVKKNMQMLQALTGPDLDANSLLQLALEKARQRVVVKWPRYEEPLKKTNESILGKTTRYDIYYSQFNGL